RESKPSSVRDDHLSRSCDRPPMDTVAALDFRPRRATCLRPDRRLLRGGLPFSAAPVSTGAEWFLLLSRLCDAPIWTVDARKRLPDFRQAPSLYAARTFL